MIFSSTRDRLYCALYEAKAFSSDRALSLESVFPEGIDPLIIDSLIERGSSKDLLRKRSDRKVYLLVDGAIFAEEIISRINSPEVIGRVKDQGILSNKLASYSLATAIFFALVSGVPSYFRNLAEDSCRTGGSGNTYGGVWDPVVCPIMVVHYSFDMTFIGSILTSVPFWLGIFSIPFFLVMKSIHHQFSENTK